MAISVHHPDPSFGEPVARVDPGLAGHRWWRYERPAVTLGVEDPPTEAPLAVVPEEEHSPRAEPTVAAASTAGPPSARRTGVDRLPPSAVPGMVGVAALLFGTLVAGHGMRLDHVGVVTFPLAGVLAALAFGKRCRRLRPDEPWLPRLILLGTLVKIGASTARYVTFAELYNNVGDAYVYDREAREMVAFWAGQRDTSPMEGLPFSGSNVMRWLTAWTYEYFGQNLLAAFLLFGLLALLGAYFWYRALSDAVPYVDKRLLLIFLLFVPSIVFWPASLGKEALMQVALGAMAWATSLAVRGRWAKAMGIALAAGLPLYLIRPHLLALATVAAAIPLALGRVRGGGRLSARPLAMIGVGVLVVFTVTAGAKFVGLENLSIDSVEENLDAQTASTSYGGSSFSHPGNSLTNPLYLPFGLVTVLFRPFLFEARGILPLMTAIESSVLIGLVVMRRSSIMLALRRWRQEPFVFYCLVLLVFYSAVFSALANFGLLTRQRSLILPALYALIALSPKAARRTVGKDALPSVDQLVPIDVPARSAAPPRRRASHPTYAAAARATAAANGNGYRFVAGNGARSNGSGVPDGPALAPTGNGHAGNGHAGNGHAGNGHAGNGHAGNGHAGNGHAGNGHAGNGHAGNGHAGNGHAGNGHAGNGHAGNGHAGNGHAENGHAGNGHAGNGHAGNGHAGNGHAGNGHAENGHAENGHAGNGHAENGHAENGHVGNGHAENGHAGNGHAENGHAGNGHAGNGHAENGHAGNGHAENGHVGNGHAGNGHAENGHAGNGHAENSHVGNGHVGNGHVGNGHAENGHAENGHAGNGHAENGHVGNGHAGNGHAENGHAGNGHAGNGHAGNGHAGNGHVGNGHVGNGHAENGHVGNGHVGNGHAGNGHAENGHAGNGHAENGHAGNGHAENGHAENGHAGNGHAENGYAENGHAGNGHAGNGHAENGHAGNGHAGNGHAGNGHAENGHAENGHVGNGHAENGHAENGHVGNGHAGNGHAENGHAGNGHAGNGHAENGHAGNGHAENGHAGNGRVGNGQTGNGHAENERVASADPSADEAEADDDVDRPSELPDQ